MSWVGALAGGAVGGMLGGPWGAALGALLGHWAEGKIGARQSSPASGEEEKQALFVVAIFVGAIGLEVNLLPEGLGL